ncbi:MAG: hypothetical protein AVDCRST_MAG87-3676, partial [uncultured Thermomicrobiales bacterium]
CRDGCANGSRERGVRVSCLRLYRHAPVGSRAWARWAAGFDQRREPRSWTCRFSSVPAIGPCFRGFPEPGTY